MHCRPSAILILLVCAAVLSGCIGGGEGIDGPDMDRERDPGTGLPDENETKENETIEKQLPTGRLLSDLTCSFRYPESEEEVPCENTFQEVELTSTEKPDQTQGTPWICIHTPEDEFFGGTILWHIYWDPLTDTYGFYYEGPPWAETLNAIFYTHDNEGPDGNVAIAWYDAPRTGFIVLPLAEPFDKNGQNPFSSRFYLHDYETDTPELEGGKIRAYWSFFDGTSHPLQVVKTDDEEYFFHNLTEGNSNNPPYELAAFEEQGQDFNITVDARHIENPGGSFNHVPMIQCT